MRFGNLIALRRNAKQALIFACALLGPGLASIVSSEREALAQGIAPAPPPAGTVFRDCANCPAPAGRSHSQTPHTARE